MKVRHFFGLLLALLFSYTSCFAAMVPFVIPAHQDPDSLIAVQSEPIGSERIEVSGDHFVRDGERFKAWGVNLSFAGSFPSHEDAPMAAERLAAAGINSVRCHHMDTLNYPNGLWHPTTGATIYPDALDRLDYYINELAQRGIYIDLNLHVGRAHSQYLSMPDPTTDYDKIVGIYMPALINAQKDFAQEMLEHVNPYRGVSYANDPAIAFVEITNEDSFFMWGSTQTLQNLPSYYADVLKQQYNTWLGNEYGDTNGLEQAWNANLDPLGDNVLTSFVDHFTDPNVAAEDKWYLEEHEGCDANFELGTYQSQAGAQFVINITDDVDWHLQLRQANLQIAAGQYYTLTFEGAAEQARSISLNVMQNHDPWGGLGLYATANLTTDWQTFTYSFTATADDDNGRVTFSFGGGDTTTFYLRNPQLRTGGQNGLLEDEYIETGTVRLFVDAEVRERSIDRMRFLAETEKAYFDGMYSFIKNDLGCDALVTGTVVFGPLGLYAQSDMDFIDSHSYWQHPVFPNTPWDPADWYINQKPMTDYINEATLFGLAGCRLGKSSSYAGKPFTVTEYNHSAPLDTQASCVPMLTSFAAAQDWDGLWLYAYTHNADDWNDGYLNSYFDIMNNPAKWGYVRAGASIFQSSGIGPVGNTYSFAGLTDPNNPVTGLADLHLTYDRDMFGVLANKAGISREDLLNNRIVNTLYETGTISSPNEANETVLDWQIGGDGKGIYTTIGNSAGIYVGHQDKFAAASNNRIEVNEPNYVSLTMTCLDSDSASATLPKGRNILITASGRCENTGMIFSPDRTTVGTNWGYAPVQIEPVEAAIRFPFKGLKCYSLAPDGTIQYDVPTRIVNDQTVIDISPAYETMWYVATVTGDINGDGEVNFKDFTKLGQYWLQNEPSVDIAPLPYGDGIVDFKDLDVLVDGWLVNLNP